MSDFEAESGNALKALTSASETAIKAVSETTEDAVETLAGSRERVIDSLRSSYKTVEMNRKELRGVPTSEYRDYTAEVDDDEDF